MCRQKKGIIHAAESNSCAEKLSYAGRTTSMTRHVQDVSYRKECIVKS